MRFSRARRSPIGVELTTDTVRLLQLEWRGDEGEVAAFAEVPRPAFAPDSAPGAADVRPSGLAAPAKGSLPPGAPEWTPQWVHEVREALSDNPFRGRRAISMMPSEEVILRHVKVEASEGQALHDALLFELEDAFPGDAPVVQHLEVGDVVERGEKRHELILIAAGLAHVKRTVGFLEACGLEPGAIDAEGCALIRCFMRRRRRASDADVHSGIFHLGPASTLVAITGAGHPLFMKRLPVGADDLYASLEQRLDVSRNDVRFAASSEEAQAELAPRVVAALRLQLDSLAQEMSACLRYHAASRRSPSGLELILSGPGALIPGVPDALGKALGSVIQRSDPFAPAYTGIKADGRVARDFAEWNVPLGLALLEAPA